MPLLGPPNTAKLDQAMCKFVYMHIDFQIFATLFLQILKFFSASQFYNYDRQLQ